MSSAASRAIVLVLILAAGSAAVCADVFDTVLPSVQTVAEPEPERKTGGIPEAVHRDIMRTVALVSLCLILVLIIFVVSLMIASRRFRVWARGWNRKIGFGKLQDVWWQGPEKDGSPKKKPKEK